MTAMNSGIIYSQTGDLERLISKVAVGRISPREIMQVRRALGAIDPIKKICSESANTDLKKIGEQLNPCNLIRDRIEKGD